MKRIVNSIFNVVEIATSDARKKLIYSIGYLCSSLICLLLIYLCVNNIENVGTINKIIRFLALFIIALCSITSLLGTFTCFITSFFSYRRSLLSGILTTLFGALGFGLLLAFVIWGYYYNLYLIYK
ncbi:MAG: hypothetical protein ACI35W_05580 [Anaeroplasmataceae bacterium]